MCVFRFRRTCRVGGGHVFYFTVFVVDESPPYLTVHPASRTTTAFPRTKQKYKERAPRFVGGSNQSAQGIGTLIWSSVRKLHIHRLE